MTESGLNRADPNCFGCTLSVDALSTLVVSGSLRKAGEVKERRQGFFPLDLLPDEAYSGVNRNCFVRPYRNGKATRQGERIKSGGKLCLDFTPYPQRVFF
jgi:hypothetical protein